MMKKIVVVVVIGLCSFFCNAQKKPNILFIAIDDLRPELGCYGSDVAITPNMDKLANEGLLFQNAYCQQAICGPSRACVLTGMRPESSGIIHNYLKIRDLHPNVVTLPQHFKNNGYESVYYGKVFHHGDLDDKLSWSRMPDGKLEASKSGYALPENQKIARENMARMVAKYGEQAKYGLGSGPAYECADVPDDTYIDGYNTEKAIATMKELVQKNNKPFFLALGFQKPHLNWIAPKKYWDLYNPPNIKLTNQDEAPLHAAAMGVHPSFELRTRSNIPNEGAINPELAVTLKHAYLACVSYVDAQIGKMVKALEEAGIRENTIIILWSDHGYHLGEMGIWGKATNYEIATRVPLMIWTPDMPAKTRGKKTDALVELVDMYPTLCELAGLEKPAQLDGKSFVPLLQNPKQSWKKAAYSQFPTPALREWGSIPLRPGMRETFFGPLIQEVEQRIQEQQKEKWDRELFENNLMGYALRTRRYRLIVWKDRTRPNEKPLFVELYDHKKDPSETVNIAAKKPKVVRQLLQQNSVTPVSESKYSMGL